MSFSAIFQVLTRLVSRIGAIFPQQWIQTRKAPTNIASHLFRGFVSAALAISIAFAMLFNLGFYILLFLPVTTLQWIWSSFVIVSAHQQGQHAITKIPIFLGLSFAMLVSILIYGLFFYPVIGLEKAFKAFFGEKTEDEPVIDVPTQDAKNTEKAQGDGRTQHDFQLYHSFRMEDIPFLDLGSAIKSDDYNSEDGTAMGLALDGQNQDDGGGEEM